MKKEALKSKEARRGVCEGLEVGKEKEKFYNCFIISKIKEVKKLNLKCLTNFGCCLSVFLLNTF